MRVCLVALLAALLGVWTVAGAEKSSKGEEARLDEYLASLTEYGFSGVVLVARAGRPILTKGYGLADREQGRPFSPDTVVSIGSITKQFTAAAILKLEVQGKLQTGDPITRFFKGVPPDKSSITLHHLLTHSAGIDSDFGDDFDPISRDEIVRRVFASKLRSPPGQRYHYSNAGYSLLAAVVEIASGQAYETFLQEQLFRPASMAHTGYRQAHWRAEDLAQGYLRGQRWGTILERPWAADGPYWMLRGNGGIHSTAGDMFRWHLALEDDRILPTAARAKLTQPHIREDGGSSSYGYGWSVTKTRRGTRLVQHNGGDGIFSADCKRFLDDGVFIYVASNNSESPAWKVSAWLAALLFGADAPTLPAVKPADAGVLADYAGRYALPGGGTMVVSPSKDGLILSGEGPNALSLLGSGTLEPSPRLRAVSERTARLVEAWGRGDYSALHKALAGPPLERVTTNQRRLRQTLETAHGPYQGFDMLGSIATGPTTETYVRFRFARGAIFQRYSWEGNRLVALGTAGGLAGARLVRPLGAGEFASFNFASGRLTRVRFTTRSGGKPTLTFPGREGEVVATRTGS